MGVKVGWRQFAVGGFHVDATVNAGYRHEVENEWDGEPIHSFQGRLWTFAGWQGDLSDRVYINTRGGTGVHLWRTDRYADREKILVYAGDLNIGVRLR